MKTVQVKRRLGDGEEKAVGDSNSKKRKTLPTKASDGQQCTDPLCLPALLVNKILGKLDDRSLLTARLVCRGWNEAVTGREDLWRERCVRGSPLFLFDTTPTTTITTTQTTNLTSELITTTTSTTTTVSQPAPLFSQLVHCQRLLYHMVRGEALVRHRVPHSLDCFPGARDRFRVEVSPTLPHRWSSSFKKLLRSAVYTQFTPNTALVLTADDDELLMADLTTQEVLWCHSNSKKDNIVVDYNPQVNALIYTSLEGQSQIRVYLADDGTLQSAVDLPPQALTGVEAMSAHASGRFLLVELEGEKLKLVDLAKGRVIALDMQLTPDKADGRKLFYHFLPDHCVSGAGLLLGVMVDDGFCLRVAVFDTEEGRILHWATWESSGLLSFHTDQAQSTNTFVLSTWKDTVEKVSVRCDREGVHWSVLWTKPIPEGVDVVGTVLCGEAFMLVQPEDVKDLLVYRMDTGKLVCSLPDFFRGKSDRGCGRLHWHEPALGLALEMSMGFLYEDLHSEGHKIYHKGSLDWLDGLSTSTTTTADMAGVIFMDTHRSPVTCLRWAKDLRRHGRTVAASKIERKTWQTHSISRR